MPENTEAVPVEFWGRDKGLVVHIIITSTMQLFTYDSNRKNSNAQGLRKHTIQMPSSLTDIYQLINK